MRGIAAPGKARKPSAGPWAASGEMRREEKEKLIVELCLQLLASWAFVSCCFSLSIWAMRFV